MTPRDQINLHADLAADALDGIKRLKDRKQGVHLGIAATHAILALAFSVEHFAAAVEPREP